MFFFGFFELINTPGVAVPTRQRWPLGDEGKQAKKHRGGSGPPPYPWFGRLDELVLEAGGHPVSNMDLF